MTVARLREIPGIGVDVIGDAADAAADPDILRLENLDTDLRPPPVAVELTRAAIDDDAANSYLPFQGHRALREAAAAHVGRLAGRRYDPAGECVIVTGWTVGIKATTETSKLRGQVGLIGFGPRNVLRGAMRHLIHRSGADTDGAHIVTQKV